MKNNKIEDIDFDESNNVDDFSGKMTFDIRGNPIRKIPIEFLSIVKNFRSIASDSGNYVNEKEKNKNP